MALASSGSFDYPVGGRKSRAGVREEKKKREKGTGPRPRYVASTGAPSRGGAKERRGPRLSTTRKRGPRRSSDDLE